MLFRSTTTSVTEVEKPVIEDLSSLANTVEVKKGNEYTIAELYKAVQETIVVVNNYQETTSQQSSDYGFFFGFGGNNSQSKEPEIALYGTGSGVFFTTDGYIITNAHVIDGATKVSVVVNDSVTGEDGVEMPATVIGSDNSTDLAVLKVERNEPFTAAAIGDSDALEVGQQVCAIGNPAGLAKTITSGIISGLNQIGRAHV